MADNVVISCGRPQLLRIMRCECRNAIPIMRINISYFSPPFYTKPFEMAIIIHTECVNGPQIRMRWNLFRNEIVRRKTGPTRYSRVTVENTLRFYDASVATLTNTKQTEFQIKKVFCKSSCVRTTRFYNVQQPG